MNSDAAGSTFSPFDWVQFPQGRARFAGTFRCWDETGRKTFALELHGREYFGEIKRSYLENQNDYNIAIDAFGYGRGEDVGMPGADARGVFTADDEVIAHNLVIQLIQAGLEYADPPTVLDQTETSRFMGKVEFQDGWILVAAEVGGTVMQ
ncbi:hypothetical protein [Solilutibacter silvestris]|uniref:hypothetical protein n=1 Tax=Solilutibacter silvestris TaxID=1645665 RepID=UPI003D33C063